MLEHGDTGDMRLYKLITTITAAAVVLTAGCSQEDYPAQGEQSTAPATQPQAERDQYPFGLACGWEFASNIDTMNIAFPDESAKYWVALVPMLPQTRLRINGHYGSMRYFSYNVYDPILRPTDAIADAELLPDAGGRNPTTDPAAPSGDSYTAYVEFTAPVEQRAPNTIYAGEMTVGPMALPQPALTALIYRSYVPEDGVDFDGGVGLPLLTLETADGEIELLPTADCVEPLLPTFGNTLPDLGVNAFLEETDFIDDPFLQSPVRIPVGSPQATTRVFYGLPSTAMNILRDFIGLPIPEGVEDDLPLPAGGGFLSNLHNAYTTNLFSRSYGNVVMIRAKAPTWRGAKSTAFGQEQLRYWSVCQNDLPTQRYVGCVRDDQAHLDDAGFFTVIVSDLADRPANAVGENAIDWMPWGPYVDALLIYRHMLPNPSFAETINRVPKGTAPIDIMGDYMPQSAYCLQDIVENAGNSAEEIFKACRAYSDSLSRLPN